MGEICNDRTKAEINYRYRTIVVVDALSTHYRFFTETQIVQHTCIVNGIVR
jgi:hypothetical protein